MQNQLHGLTRRTGQCCRKPCFWQTIAHEVQSYAVCGIYSAVMEGPDTQLWMMCRAEACGAMQLTTKKDASGRDGHAFMLRAVATNQDGRSSALTAPNGRAQQAVIQTALDLASASPLTLSLVQV